MLAGAVRADEGDVFLKGDALALRSPLDARRAGIATVFQELSLIPDLSVAANLFYSDKPRVRAGRIDKRELRQKAAATLHELGVEGIDVSRPIRELSLTQRQVIEISKAVIRKPAVLVLDEPTSAMLPEQVGWLFAKVREFAEAGGIAVFISHRLEEIENLCHRATVFRGGVDVGSGAIDEMPEARLVELMLGRKVDRVYPERDDAGDTSKQVVCEVTEALRRRRRSTTSA